MLEGREQGRLNAIKSDRHIDRHSTKEDLKVKRCRSIVTSSEATSLVDSHTDSIWVRFFFLFLIPPRCVIYVVPTQYLWRRNLCWWEKIQTDTLLLGGGCHKIGLAIAKTWAAIHFRKITRSDPFGAILFCFPMDNNNLLNGRYLRSYTRDFSFSTPRSLFLPRSSHHDGACRVNSKEKGIYRRSELIWLRLYSIVYKIMMMIVDARCRVADHVPQHVRLNHLMIVKYMKFQFDSSVGLMEVDHAWG